MILNEDFDVIGETRFPDFTYISTLHYIGKDGLYLSDSHYKNPSFDENKLRFRRFKLVHYPAYYSRRGDSIKSVRKVMYVFVQIEDMI